MTVEQYEIIDSTLSDIMHIYGGILSTQIAHTTSHTYDLALMTIVNKIKEQRIYLLKEFSDSLPEKDEDDY